MTDENIKLLVGLKLKNYRKQHQYTQEQLASILDVDLSGYNKLENGKVFPSFETLCKIIKLLKFEPNTLFDFTEYSNEDEILIEKIVLEKIKSLPPSKMKKLINLLDVL